MARQSAAALVAGQRRPGRRKPPAPRRRRAAPQLASCTRGEELGRGVAGVVYKTCCGGRCAYATKVFLSARDFAQAMREMRLQMVVAKAGLAPRIVQAGCGGGECTIVMERIRMTLGQFVTKADRRGLTDAQQTAIVRMLERVAKLGVDHGDVHSGNIAVDLPFSLRMIDFSESRKGAVNVPAQVAKLVGDLGVLFPRLRFPVLEAYAARGRPAAAACDDEGRFLKFIRAQTGLDVDNEDVQDAVLDIWMDGPSDCAVLLRKVKRRFKLPV